MLSGRSRAGLAVAFAALVAAATAGAHSHNGFEAEGPAAGSLGELADMMCGSFTSAAQARADSGYFDIRLEMVPIWRERSDAVWIYVEQAVAERTDRPYRQRVYRVSEAAPGRFVSEVFELPDPLRFAGAGADPLAFAALTPDSLIAREGCAVHLERTEDGAYEGSTRGDACASNLRGASHATSVVRITSDRLTSWDRGFDAGGNQVWGAETGPYVFDRVEREEEQE